MDGGNKNGNHTGETRGRGVIDVRIRGLVRCVESVVN